MPYRTWFSASFVVPENTAYRTVPGFAGPPPPQNCRPSLTDPSQCTEVESGAAPRTPFGADPPRSSRYTYAFGKAVTLARPAPGASMSQTSTAVRSFENSTAVWPPSASRCSATVQLVRLDQVSRPHSARASPGVPVALPWAAGLAGPGTEQYDWRPSGSRIGSRSVTYRPPRWLSPGPNSVGMGVPGAPYCARIRSWHRRTAWSYGIMRSNSAPL